MLTSQDWLPAEVVFHICSFLHPKDVTTFACINTASSIQVSDDGLWKLLWYRDYGNLLLQWKVGRQVLARSLSLSINDDDDGIPSNLEARLSQRLDALAASSNAQRQQQQSVGGLKEFYFVFGDIFINYLLAGRNQNNPSEQHCLLLGLHGHVFDFTHFAHYHPGLIEPILQECGQDATHYFEDIPHSMGARAIARRLCIVVNRTCLPNDDKQSSCGLYLPPPVNDLPKLLQLSNTRPPRLLAQNHPNPTDTNQQQHQQWMSRVLPRKPNPTTQRPPTLKRIRIQWDAAAHEERQKMVEARSSLSFWARKSTKYRVYYDPFRQEWKKWDPCGTTERTTHA
jgi:hypothetical protein